MSDPHYDPGTSAPLCPDREYDLPAGERSGGGAALRVPVVKSSSGPMVLDRTSTSETELIEREPSLEPLRVMEAGADWTPEAERRIHELDRPVDPWPR